MDVRATQETADGVIAGARCIPLPALSESLDVLDSTVPVVVYCASGYRSMVAASVLRVAGFEDVSDLIGGFAAWREAGCEVARG